MKPQQEALPLMITILSRNAVLRNLLAAAVVVGAYFAVAGVLTALAGA